jgi:hypothetical protein
LCFVLGNRGQGQKQGRQLSNISRANTRATPNGAWDAQQSAGGYYTFEESVREKSAKAGNGFTGSFAAHDVLQNLLVRSPGKLTHPIPNASVAKIRELTEEGQVPISKAV